ncbi:MAG: hypothetical protein FH761_02310 [Firmicutes bacterium]|nr:hypothetical protein [Bacillota bacterium]
MTLSTIEFPVDKIRLTPVYKNNDRLCTIKKSSFETNIPRKIIDGYGPIYFPKSHKDRPYIYSSMVLTLDGKSAFEDENKSSAISKGNYLDPDGGLADLWILNILRTYADGIIFGAKTLQVEENITGHIYDQELAEDRISILGKKEKIPWNIIVTRKGTGVPLDHIIFKNKEVPICIATSPEGFNNISHKLNREYLVLRDKYEAKNITQKRILDKNKIVFVVTGNGNKINLTHTLNIFRSMGIHRLLIESPTFMYVLMQEKKLDEAFMNYSGIYAGGEFTLGRNQAFSYKDFPATEILSIHIHRSSFLYTRQKIDYKKSSS